MLAFFMRFIVLVTHDPSSVVDIFSPVSPLLPEWYQGVGAVKPVLYEASVIELPRSAKLTIPISPLFSHKIDRCRRHAKDSAVGHLSIQKKASQRNFCAAAMKHDVHGTKEGGLRSRSRWSCFGGKHSCWFASGVFQKYGFASVNWHGITRLRF